LPGASSVAAASISPFREADGDLVYVSYDGATGSELTIGVDTAARSIGLITYSGATTGGALSVDVIHSFPSVGDGTTGIPQISAENQMVGSIYVAGSIGSIVGGTFGEGETISTLSAGAAGDVGNISLEGDVLGGIHVGGDLVGTISAGSILGDLSIGGDLASEGNIITSGTLGSGWWITVSGDLAGDILVGADLAASVSVGGDMSGTLTAGNLLGDSSIGGDMSSAGQIIATGGSEFGTAMSVSGSLRGNVQIGGDVSVHVYHDLSGTLAAANFGNITIGNGVIRTGNVTSSGTIATNGSLGNFIVWGTHGSNIYVAQGIQGEYKQYGAQASYNLGDVAFPFWSHMDFAETDGDVVHVSYDGPWQSWITLTLGANGEGIQDVTYSYAGEGTTEGWSLGVTATGGDGQTSVGAIYAGDSIVRAIEITGTLGALSAGYLPYGSTISATNIGNITLTDWLDGDIYASGDVTGLIYAACEISGNIVIDGHLSGTIQTYQDLSGVISAGSGGSGGIVVGGNVTETAAIYTGSTLGSLTVTGHNFGWTGGGPILSCSVGDTTGWPTGYTVTAGHGLLLREGDGDLIGIVYAAATESSISLALDGSRSISSITYSSAKEGNFLFVDVLEKSPGASDDETSVGAILAPNQVLGSIWVGGALGSITAGAMVAGGMIFASTQGNISLGNWGQTVFMLTREQDRDVLWAEFRRELLGTPHSSAPDRGGWDVPAAL
jgi:hypothetical protein